MKIRLSLMTVMVGIGVKMLAIAVARPIGKTDWPDGSGLKGFQGLGRRGWFFIGLVHRTFSTGFSKGRAVQDLRTF